MKEEAWFDFTKEIRRPYAKRSWIPLKVSASTKEGEHGSVDFAQTYEGVHSLLIPVATGADGDKYSWSSDISGDRSYAFADAYKPVDEYQDTDREYFGSRLVLTQRLPGMLVAEWHLNQDVVFALRLFREGDSWVRPDEGFAEVVRLKRDASGEPNTIEMRAEFLRDYLCARAGRLRLATYRDRDATISKEFAETLKGMPEEVDFESGRLTRRAWETDGRGGLAGGTFAIFQVGRSDIDDDADAPIMGPPTDENTTSSSRTGAMPSSGIYRGMVEYWRDEWVEPGPNSLRVREDDIKSQINFIVDPDGSSMNSDDLDDEDIGRWLWFQPNIVNALLQYRGNELHFETAQTGGILTSSGMRTHFGINALGLVNVYAFDIARLSEWEKKIWAGFNITPEGGVSSELLTQQAKGEYVETPAPEKDLPKILRVAASEFSKAHMQTLFREHDKSDDILARVHRFRAVEASGLLALAKDATRMTADLLNVDGLRKALQIEKGDKRGSLKLLEGVLGLTVKDFIAKEVMSPLFAAYDLRISDAHPPASELREAYALLKIDESQNPVEQGRQLLFSLARAWSTIARIFAGAVPDHVKC